MFKDVLTQEFLTHHLVLCKKTQNQLAKEVGCSPVTIFYYTKLHQVYDTYIMSTKFGKLKPIKLGQTKNGARTMDCLCDCGNYKNVRINCLLRGVTKSCGCIKPRLNGSFTKTRYSEIRYRAKKKGIPFCISFEYLVKLFATQNGICKISGLEIKFMKKYNDRDSNTASLDRIDPSGGYVEGNVQWVHKHINNMKWTMSQDYFINLCNIISDHNKSQQKSKPI